MDWLKTAALTSLVLGIALLATWLLLPASRITFEQLWGLLFLSVIVIIVISTLVGAWMLRLAFRWVLNMKWKKV